MKKMSTLISRNLSAITLFLFYIILAVYHIIEDSFLWEDQLSLIIVMAPFVIIGAINDLLIKRRPGIDKTLRIVAQLLPSGVFVMQVISNMMLTLDKEPSELFHYLIWLFLALPFLITSYVKEEHKPKLIFSIIGTVFVAAIYLYLTTMTDELNEGSGAVILFFSFFSVLYAASGLRKLPYLGAIIGILNAAAMLWLRYFPSTEAARMYGWDYDIASNVEILMILTLIVCILLRFFASFQKKEAKLIAEAK